MKTEALRPFIPAQDIEASLAFYTALGFTTERYAPDLAMIRHGSFTALVQRYPDRAYAENYMLQWLVDDLDQLWTHIDSLDLATTFAVPPPKAPAMQPWGMREVNLIDPAGVCWHIA